MIGEYVLLDICAAVEFPIVEDVIDARLAVMPSNLDDYYKNTFDNSRVGEENVLLVRPTLRIRLADEIDWTIIGEYNRNHNMPTPQQNDSWPDRLDGSGLPAAG